MRERSYAGRAFRAAAALALCGSVWIAPGSAPAQSDTLRVGVATLPPSRGMPHSHAGAITSYTYAAIFDFLAEANENGDMVPALATSWRNLTPTKWEFDIRPDTAFSNGEPLTAETVAAVFAWYLSDEGKATVVGRAVSRAVARAQAVDADTLEIESLEPNPALPAQLYAMHVFEPKAFRDLGMDGYAQQPVGTGPFRVTAWNPESVELEAVPTSWRAPKMQKMTITPLPEPTSRVQALLSGQIDLAPAIPVDSVEQVKAAGGYEVDIYPAPYVLSWAFLSTYRDTPFKDIRVRKAVNLAIDREAMIENLLLGRSAPATQPATPVVFGYDPDVEPFPYDPERAKQLLADAGYPDGFEMDVVVLPGNFPADKDIYQQAAQDLANVGIRTNLRAITFAEFVQVITAPGKPEDYGKAWGEKVYAHQYDFSVDIVPDASARLINPWGCRRPVPFWCNEEEDALLTKAQAEFDVEKRREILQELMQMFHDHAPALFLVQVVDVVGRSADVQNAKLVYRVLNYDEISKAN